MTFEFILELTNGCLEFAVDSYESVIATEGLEFTIYDEGFYIKRFFWRVP